MLPEVERRLEQLKLERREAKERGELAVEIRLLTRQLRLESGKDEDGEWPEKCGTCGKPYVLDEITVCSSSFHCCRDCEWEDGVAVIPCEREGHDPG